MDNVAVSRMSAIRRYRTSLAWGCEKSEERCEWNLEAKDLSRSLVCCK